MIYSLFERKARKEERERPREKERVDDLTIYVSFFITTIFLFTYQSSTRIFSHYTQYKCSLWQCEKRSIHLTLPRGEKALATYPSPFFYQPPTLIPPPPPVSPSLGLSSIEIYSAAITPLHDWVFLFIFIASLLLSRINLISLRCV